MRTSFHALACIPPLLHRGVIAWLVLLIEVSNDYFVVGVLSSFESHLFLASFIRTLRELLGLISGMQCFATRPEQCLKAVDFSEEITRCPLDVVALYPARLGHFVGKIAHLG